MKPVVVLGTAEHLKTDVRVIGYFKGFRGFDWASFSAHLVVRGEEGTLNKALRVPVLGAAVTSLANNEKKGETHFAIRCFTLYHFCVTPNRNGYTTQCRRRESM